MLGLSLKILIYLFILFLVIGVGAFGTYFIGNYYHAFNVNSITYVDAFYFTIVTLSTVGSYIYPITNLGKLFISFLILFGLGLFLLTLSLIAGEIMEQRAENLTDRLSGLQKRLLNNHIVLIGTDSVNLVLADSMNKINKNFVIISTDKNEVDKLKSLNYKAYEADITSEEEMKNFSLDKASKIIIDLSNGSLLLYTFLIVNSLAKDVDKIIIVHSQETERRLDDLNLPSNCIIINPSNLVAVNIVNSLIQKDD